MHVNCPPGRTRRLGRSRRYTAVDLPARLRRWHAPRANRWECLHVIAGALDTEWLDPAGITIRRFSPGERCWIAPGSRWRIASIAARTSFELEIHADETVAAAAPQALRAALLDDLPVTRIDQTGNLARALEAIAPGELTLLRARFDCTIPLREAIHAGGGTLFWHPLETGSGASTAVVVRSALPVGLDEYLSRDHAVIESALAGALRGNREHGAWLRSTLARHLRIEEALLFPAYLDAGGRPGWVRGLCNEHELLRHHLPHLDDATSRRRFLLLLDGHDEKEERIVYPDILARLADQAEALTRVIVQYPLAPGTPLQNPLPPGEDCMDAAGRAKPGALAEGRVREKGKEGSSATCWRA